MCGYYGSDNDNSRRTDMFEGKYIQNIDMVIAEIENRLSHSKVAMRDSNRFMAFRSAELIIKNYISGKDIKNIGLDNNGISFTLFDNSGDDKKCGVTYTLVDVMGWITPNKGE